MPTHPKSIPKYILRALERRRKAAEQLSVAECEIEEYCKRIGFSLEAHLDDAMLGTSFFLMTEPSVAYRVTKEKLEEYLAESNSACKTGE